MNTTGNSRPFAECSVIERDRALVGIVGVEVGDERDRLEERLHPLHRTERRGRSATGRIGVARRQPSDRNQATEIAGVDLLVELLRDADQLLQVLDAALRLDRALGSQLGEVARALEHGFDRVPDTAVGLVGDLVEEIEQVGDAAQRPSRHARRARGSQRFAERDPGTLRVRLDLRDRRVADATLRRVDDPLPRNLVVGIDERAQVRECVLYLAAIVELHSAEHAVWDPRAYQRLLDDATLRVRAVEDRDVAEAVVGVVGEPPHLTDDERRLVVLVFGLVTHDRRAIALFGPEVLRSPGRVVGDDGVGRVEDALRRAVVLVEDDDRRVGKRLLELREVAVIGPAELVDGVVRDDALGDEVVRARRRGRRRARRSPLARPR